MVVKQRITDLEKVENITFNNFKASIVKFYDTCLRYIGQWKKAFCEVEVLEWVLLKNVRRHGQMLKQVWNISLPKDLTCKLMTRNFLVYFAVEHGVSKLVLFIFAVVNFNDFFQLFEKYSRGNDFGAFLNLDSNLFN